MSQRAPAAPEPDQGDHRPGGADRGQHQHEGGHRVLRVPHEVAEEDQRGGHRRDHVGGLQPGGLVALRSEISGINQAIDNSSRASNVISTAEGALSEVASLLLNVKNLIVQAANSGQ